MTVTLTGAGCGAPETMTAEVQQALEQADLIVGARRLLEALPPQYTSRRRAATKPAEILALLEEERARCPCVVYSGDSGFYSGTRHLLPLLKARGVDAREIGRAHV